MIKYLKSTFVSSFVVLCYIILVAALMKYGERIFGKMDDVLGPVAFLLLFTLSALVVGVLLLGKPIMLYLENKKKEAVSTIFAFAIWLALFMVIVFLILIIK